MDPQAEATSTPYVKQEPLSPPLQMSSGAMISDSRFDLEMVDPNTSALMFSGEPAATQSHATANANLASPDSVHSEDREMSDSASSKLCDRPSDESTIEQSSSSVTSPSDSGLSASSLMIKQEKVGGIKQEPASPPMRKRYDSSACYTFADNIKDEAAGSDDEEGSDEEGSDGDDSDEEDSDEVSDFQKARLHMPHGF